MIVKIVNHAIAQRILTPLLFVALPVGIATIKPVRRAGLGKENGITCDKGKLGNMHKGVKGAICPDPLRNGRVGTVLRNHGSVHSHRSSQAESRRNRRTRRGEAEDRGNDCRVMVLKQGETHGETT